MERLRTIDVARRVGVSVNTIRAYEQLGYLSPVRRAPNGYRQFNERHVCQVKMIRQAMCCTWIGGTIRQTALEILTSSAKGNHPRAVTAATQLITLLSDEKTLAEEALAVLERWIPQPTPDPPQVAWRIGEIAQMLHVTIDELRSWERNGLLDVPRAPNGYRLYGAPEVDRLLLIRTLRRARYSTMSILRLLEYLDQGQTAHLREVLDTPTPDLGFEEYPTDSWLSTLDVMLHAAQTIYAILQDLANPP